MVELLEQADEELLRHFTVVDTAAIREFAANFLLDNGVIVPSCKVGECVYIVTKNSTVPMLSRVDNMFFDGETIQFNADDEVFCDFSEDDLGDAVFLTYKQAAQAIKERE